MQSICVGGRPALRSSLIALMCSLNNDPLLDLAGGIRSKQCDHVLKNSHFSIKNNRKYYVNMVKNEVFVAVNVK